MEGSLSSSGTESKWFRVDLPGDGSLRVTLRVSEMAPASASHVKDSRRPFDIAAAVYDNDFEELARVDEKDGRARKRSHTFSDLRGGRYYIHLFVQNNLTRASYEVELTYRPASPAKSASSSVSPGDERDGAGLRDLAVRDGEKKRVALNTKAAVKPPTPASATGPAGTPAAPDPSINRGGSDKTSSAPSGPAGDLGNVAPPAGQAVAGPVKAEIRGIRASGRGSSITLNRGKKHGVRAGWTGQILDSDGERVGVTFKVLSVSQRSARAKVKFTLDQLGAFRDDQSKIFVVLSPP